jgi:hypothetical protein
MRTIHAAPLLALGLIAAGCDARPPRQTIPPGNAAPSEIEASGGTTTVVNRPKTRPKRQLLYQGRTPEQWGQLVNSRDAEEVWRACLALRILGAAGRPHLVKGLQSSSPEARRMCLATLSVCDLRVYGEEGRRMLVELAGDDADVRIRERATLYLSQWNRAIPAP